MKYYLRWRTEEDEERLYGPFPSFSKAVQYFEQRRSLNENNIISVFAT